MNKKIIDIKMGWTKKKKYGDGGDLTSPMRFSEEDFGSMRTPIEPLAIRTAQPMVTEYDIRRMGGDPFLPEYFSEQTKAFPGSEIPGNPDQMSIKKKKPSAMDRLGKIDPTKAAQITSAFAGPMSQMIATNRYQYPDLTMDIPDIQAPEIDFSREMSQVQEDTRTFDRAVERNTSSTPLMAAMMTARRAQASRERASIGQTRENMNKQLQLQVDRVNQGKDIAVEQQNITARAELAKFENEKIQKNVDATMKLSENFAMMIRDNKMTEADQFKTLSSIFTSDPRSARWYLYNFTEAKGAEWVAERTGLSVDYIKGQHAEVKRMGVEVARQEAIDVNSEMARYETLMKEEKENEK